MIEQIKNPPPLEYTRTQLRLLARDRGLREYSGLRKYQLFQRLIGNGVQILDWEDDARMANVPFLTPTRYIPPQATPSSSSSSSNDVKDLIDYLDEATKRPKSTSYRSASELQMKLNKLRKEIDDIYERMKIFEVKESNSALKNFARVDTIDGKLRFDPQSFLDGARENMIRVLRDNRNTKVKLILKCYLDFPTTNEIKPANFHSCIAVNLDGTNEEDLYDTMVDRVLENIAKYMAMGIDVRFHSIILLELHTVSYKPLRGETYVPLPEDLADKKAIINIQNKDNKCFLWCVLWAINPDEKNPQKLDTKLIGKENTLKMEGIDYPVNLKDLGKFEKQIQSVSITVLGY